MALSSKLCRLAAAAVGLLFLAGPALAADQDCSCGFYDDTTGDLFTESLIQYFNETADLDQFILENFEHKSEKSWNSKFRQGALPDNVVDNSTSLELYCDPYDDAHVVNGGSIRSVRRDIQYGSFRSLMRGPRQGMGGSSLTMRLLFNETESLEINVMNTDSNATAWVSTLMQNEWPDRDLGINYTILGNSSLANGTAWPWDFMEFRIDWTDKEVRYYVGQNNSRTVTKKKHGQIPMTPSPLYFRHWSIGNTYSMEGPPYFRSVANVGWMRMFFNTSTMTDDQHEVFDARCTIEDACSMNDMDLRLVSSYATNATVKWKHHDPRGGLLAAPVWISVIMAVFSTFLLIHSFVKRAVSKKPAGHGHGHGQPSGSDSDRSSPAPEYRSSEPSIIASSSTTPFNQTRPGTPDKKYSSEALPRRSDLTPSGSGYSTPLPRYESREYLGRYDEDAISPVSSTPTLPNVTPDTSAYPPTSTRASSLRNAVVYTDNSAMPEYALPDSARDSAQTLVPRTPISPFLPKSPTSPSAPPPWSPKNREKGFGAARIKEVVEEPKEHPLKTATNAADTKAADKIPTAKKARVDYLAGLVALCSIFVTLIHFHLTYVPAVVIPGAFVHYPSELWAERLISPFIMNQMWLGVFFTTSTRFLSARYFREGKLDVIAERAVKRAPRLMIPVTAMVLFEYFFIDVGATKYLEYLPSVTWSTWGYVAKFPSVGHFISEILELVYLIPNAVPQITFNYCTGVLWTIAVQLQGSWVVLLGAILIREIKTPWKRFGYYAFCVVNNWYARNWGSFFWLGLMLTDLDITYKWRKYLYPRPLVYYPLICFCSFMTLVGFTMNLLPQWISFNFTTHENGIHPDQETGLPIMETDNYGYPNYYEPRFNMLLFAVGMQAIVELSAVVQKILSFPLLVWVFPHIFTIYLIHGFIFWSWGAWLCVFLASRDFVYWLNILLTGVTCYAIIILSLPIVTPAIEILGRDITINIWEFANQKPPPKKDTLFPFNKDELGMQGEKSEEQTTGKEEEYSEKHQTKFDEKNVV
ncbi:Glycoside hydrolase family 16 [Neofusicoccum parvum]|uniref:Glycoside hydrolase family 16 n=1 Tax=Neofusicoccum parvum TaxID=310453 RepID=A0ACB5S036_9PEZI|nr:Glycoside hydrolase family 16 [Neofusicoccum parvum]